MSNISELTAQLRMILSDTCKSATTYIAGSSNGRTTVSGSVYLGSSPGPAADFVFFASEAFHTKKLKIASRMFPQETQEVFKLKKRRNQQISTFLHFILI